MPSLRFMGTRFSVSLLFSLNLACASDYEIVAKKPDIDPSDVTDCSFEPIVGTKMSRYICNPVFAQTNEAWNQGLSSVAFHATEVLGHPFYQLWYTSRSESSYGLGYAVSDNGIEWKTHPSNPIIIPTAEQWDQDSMAGQIVLWDQKTEEYVMAYQGVTLGNDDFDYGTWGLGIATSSDGVHWEKHSGNPVINFLNDFVTEAGQRPCWPLTLKRSDEGYTGYIASATVGGGNACNMYALSTTDLVRWEFKSETPILSAGFSFDRLGFSDAAIVEWVDSNTGNKTLYMFYVGFADLIAQGNHSVVSDSRLGLAISTDDGESWEKSPNNPFPVQQTEMGNISSVGAKRIGSRIHLWVGDSYEGSGAIGYFYYEPEIDPHE